MLISWPAVHCLSVSQHVTHWCRIVTVAACGLLSRQNLTMHKCMMVASPGTVTKSIHTKLHPYLFSKATRFSINTSASSKVHSTKKPKPTATQTCLGSGLEQERQKHMKTWSILDTEYLIWHTCLNDDIVIFLCAKIKSESKHGVREKEKRHLLLHTASTCTQ